MGLIERMATAVREEIVRQYREDGRGECPAGACYYEEHIAPVLIVRAALKAALEPTEAMAEAGFALLPDPQPDEELSLGAVWRAMIEVELNGEPS